MAGTVVVAGALVAAIGVLASTSSRHRPTAHDSKEPAPDGSVEEPLNDSRVTPRFDRPAADGIRRFHKRRPPEATTPDLALRPVGEPNEPDLELLKREIRDVVMPELQKCQVEDKAWGKVGLELYLVEEPGVGLAVAGVEIAADTTSTRVGECLEDRLFGFVLTPVESSGEFSLQIAVVFSGSDGPPADGRWRDLFDVDPDVPQR